MSLDRNVANIIQRSKRNSWFLRTALNTVGKHMGPIEGTIRSSGLGRTLKGMNSTLREMNVKLDKLDRT